MEQKKIEHITLHLIVFGTIAIIGVLARQTVLHYGWDEFSSYLILVVSSIIMGAIYLNLQMVFRQLLSPTIEKCFMRFECYRNKAVVVEAPAANSELAGSSINSKPIISEPEPEIEIETTSDITEEVSTLSYYEPNEDVAELPKEETTPSTNNTALNRLCGYVAEYYLLDTLPKVEPIKVDSQLKTIDIMHFGWNIGKAFSKPRLQTATFIKRVFTHTLRDSEISTIERKMSHTESECKIKLDRKIA